MTSKKEETVSRAEDGKDTIDAEKDEVILKTINCF